MRVWELVSLALIVQQKPNLKWKKKLFEIVFIQKIFRARRVSKTIINAVEWWFGFVRRKRRVRQKSGLRGRRFADRISGHAPGMLVGGGLEVRQRVWPFAVIIPPAFPRFLRGLSSRPLFFRIMHSLYTNKQLIWSSELTKLCVAIGPFHGAVFLCTGSDTLERKLCTLMGPITTVFQ